MRRDNRDARHLPHIAPATAILRHDDTKLSRAEWPPVHALGQDHRLSFERRRNLGKRQDRRIPVTPGDHDDLPHRAARAGRIDSAGCASTVFVLHPAVADELTRALLTLAQIEETGIKRIVYLSMIGADRFADSPRAAAKWAAEQTIARRGLSATILRPNALFQNDIMQKDALTSHQTYTTPVGKIGLTMIDGRDVAEVAALELLRRERSGDPLPAETIELVGPEAFTGESIVRLWSDVLGKQVTYAGDDLEAVQTAFRTAMSSADAYSLAMIFRSIVQDGVLGASGAADQLVERLGHPLRT